MMAQTQSNSERDAAKAEALAPNTHGEAVESTREKSSEAAEEAARLTTGGSTSLHPVKRQEATREDSEEEGESSSGVESSESESESESGSEDESDVDLETTAKSKEEEKELLDEMISQAADVDLNGKYGPMTQNEVARTEAELSPLPGCIGDDEEITVAGQVMSVQKPLNSLVLKSTSKPEETSIKTLDQDSLICTQGKDMVGRIEEVFGPVINPFYVVRLMGEYSVKNGEEDEEHSMDTAKELPACGDILYVAEKFKKVVDPSKLNKVGSDASNLYNEEPAPEEVEYSDDEAEKRARQQRKAERRNTDANNGQPQLRQRHTSRIRGRSDRPSYRGRPHPQPVNWATSPPPPLPPVPQHVHGFQPSYGHIGQAQLSQFGQGYYHGAPSPTQPYAQPLHSQPYPSNTGAYFNQHGPAPPPSQPYPSLYAGHSSYQEAAAHMSTKQRWRITDNRNRSKEQG